jgi:hypothetical protein
MTGILNALTKTDGAFFLSLTPFYFTSRGRLKPKQASGLYPTKIWSPEFRAAGVIAAVSLVGPMLRHVIA